MSIKKENNKYIWLFIVINAVIFWKANITLDFGDTEKLIKDILSVQLLISIIIPLIAIILNGLITIKIKEIIVFWKINNPLPGSRAFSNLAPQDYRIDIGVLKQKHGDLPSNPSEQNRLWYKIYKANEKKESIIESHKTYLLTRDLTSMSVFFVIIFTISLFFLHTDIITKIIYISFLIIQYIILAFVTQNYANRFVCNVLAEDSAKKE